ncbi:MAG: NAD(P)/FAD-dependent oxidoreductase [Clostridiales bacterium]|nr:NAD(P)/FAD-dependent oxidoreductase [Clostridiales bacterium]
MFDAVVVGGGVIGATILRELTKYDLSVLMLEKESDVCMGQSKANSGISHAGYDAKPGSLKAKFNVLGNKMMPAFASDLGVKYKNNGSLVVAYSEEEIKTLQELKERGEENGVESLEIIGREELVKLEPNIADNAVGALFAKTGGIVCPYELSIASIGNAMDNGAKLMLDFEVVAIEKNDGYYLVKSSDGREVEAKIVINASGINSAKIAKMVGDNSFEVKGRKGEYILLDRESGDFCSHTIFKTPTEKGKGILVTQTVDGNILLGPTAENVEDNLTYTTETGLDFVKRTASEMTKNVPFYNTITSFAGVRAFSDRHDFIIEESKVSKGFINCAGIESPGLTSAPAIAKYVVEELVSKLLTLNENKNFNGKRTADYFFKNLSVEEKNEIIKKDKRYGKIVCRCEEITEGEIVRAIHENPPATTVDAVKRRVRAGMGRCQGGFCQPHVAEIISRELNIPMEDVLKSGKNSKLLVGKTK